ncbi:prepilin peptidase [Aliiroseovarius lamellibrachiae]|uniref:prepilin peptidase n=1 Tax=Aliiroseovarius lamellibrachiae TaxID=1924933 RepID=UPI001BE10C3C|nr:A24 family peptidase [Aliiroseovarius lamellibrachiae]MBT2132696.1 A24 family peptidase [Aliiroseovarius lamellibrachiae]
MQKVSFHSLVLLHLLVYGLALFIIAPGAGWPAIALCAPLIWGSVIDIIRYEIPDEVSALLVLGGSIWIFTIPSLNAYEHILGALIWPVLFYAVRIGHFLFRKAHGLGLGDVKLIAGIGLWCGLLDTITVVLGAALAGILVLLLPRIMPGKRHAPPNQLMVAFGPYLCLSAWCVWLSKVGI